MPRISQGNELKSQARAQHQTLAAATKHGLVVLFLFSLAVIILLSFSGRAGLVGQWISLGLRLALGWGGYVVPGLLLGVGYALLAPGRMFRAVQLSGLGIVSLGLAGLLHSVLPPAAWWQAVEAGRGGGYLGYISLFPLSQVFGFWGAIVLLCALTVAGILVMFQTSLDVLVGHLRRVWEFVLSLRVGRNASLQPATQATAALTPEPKMAVLTKVFKSRVVEPKVKPVQPPLLEIKSAPRAPRVQLPIDLLEERTGKPTSGDIEANQEKIQRTLENFGIQVEMGGVNVGPTVTQYTLKPAEGVKLASITALANDLALALAAHPIRIEAPIPGQSLVGIEVPNQAVAAVGLREVLQSEAFKKRSSNLAAGLGKDVAGKPWVADIERMPHLLIAGATGSGKSVCINCIIVSLLYSNSPDELKFIIIDPKRVELASYNGIPHLLTPVITEVNKTINALKWVVGEMDRRYHVLSGAAKRNLRSFNESVTEAERLPYLVVVVDELADLMAVAAAEVETAIIRLAQMARAVGIHLVVATQRPSVDVITGLIKANITSRIAFAVASGTDSRTILDMSGAEKLLGRGDCLFVSAELSKPKRLQGALITDAEIERVTAALKATAQPSYNPEVVVKTSASTNGMVGDENAQDDLLGEAKVVVVRAGKASASLLQRRLRVGYARAARLLDLLEEQGVIGPADGAKPRDVLVSGRDIENDLTNMPGALDSEGGNLGEDEVTDQSAEELDAETQAEAGEEMTDKSEDSEEERLT